MAYSCQSPHEKQLGGKRHFGVCSIPPPFLAWCWGSCMIPPFRWALHRYPVTPILSVVFCVIPRLQQNFQVTGSKETSQLLLLLGWKICPSSLLSPMLRTFSHAWQKPQCFPLSSLSLQSAASLLSLLGTANVSTWSWKSRLMCWGWKKDELSLVAGPCFVPMCFSIHRPEAQGDLVAA